MKKVINFFTVEMSDLAFYQIPKNYRKKFSLSIQLNSSKYYQQRRSETILSWLGEVGGLSDALFLLFSPAAAYISALSFNLSVTNGIPTMLHTKTSLNSTVNLNTI